MQLGRLAYMQRDREGFCGITMAKWEVNNELFCLIIGLNLGFWSSIIQHMPLAMVSEVDCVLAIVFEVDWVPCVRGLVRVYSGQSNLMLLLKLNCLYFVLDLN